MKTCKSFIASSIATLLLLTLYVEAVQVLQKSHVGYNGDSDGSSYVMGGRSSTSDQVEINVQVVNRASAGYAMPSVWTPTYQSRYGRMSERGKVDVYGDDMTLRQNERMDRESQEESQVVEQRAQVPWMTDLKPLNPNDVNSELADPPPHDQVARMARFIVANSNWTSMATVAARDPIRGFPFANVFSVSDGPVGESSGVPYMYLTGLEISVIDLKEDNRASLTMSLAQGDYCRKHEYDPEDPRCAHVILTGNVVKLANTSQEAQFAQRSLFSRHPEMPEWPRDHGWFFAKLNIGHILVLDYFGGAKTVTPEEYFHPNK